jgi:hypothetical protein
MDTGDETDGLSGWLLHDTSPRHIAAASFRGTQSTGVVQPNAQTPREELFRKPSYSSIVLN